MNVYLHRYSFFFHILFSSRGIITSEPHVGRTEKIVTDFSRHRSEKRRKKWYNTNSVFPWTTTADALSRGLQYCCRARGRNADDDASMLYCYNTATSLIFSSFPFFFSVSSFLQFIPNNRTYSIIRTSASFERARGHEQQQYHEFACSADRIILNRYLDSVSKCCAALPRSTVSACINPTAVGALFSLASV